MIKQILRNLTPPILFSLFRTLKQRLNLGSSIYNGLYKTSTELPPTGENPFVHENWISYVSNRVESRKNGVANQDMHEMCLSLIASLLPTGRDSAQTIVDFGGGIGMYWPTVSTQNKALLDTDFVVVDNLENCIKGKIIFGDQDIEFFSDFKEAVKNRKIKLLNVASTLHYCIDYQQVITMLCNSKADYIVVSRHPAQSDALPVAYTVQNVTSPKGLCGQIPVVLLSVRTLSDLMKEHGYVLIADYYSNADPDKYFKYTKVEVPAEYLRIIDHALVFQHRAGVEK